MIKGIGTDLVKISRLKEIIEGKNGEAFTKRWFSINECEYCNNANGDERFSRYAARFAAKEAFLKAIGIGIGNGYILKEVEVIKDSKGKPSISLSGKSKESYNIFTTGKTHLSISHEGKYALAFVTIE